jgi:Domain of unknown function (DUF4148)
LLFQAVAMAAVLAIPAVSFAQTSAPITRAEVRAELAQLEKAGYNPAGDHPQYPQNIQAAEARVAAQNDMSSGYGGLANGSSASGSPFGPATNAGTMSVYFGH